MGVVENIIATCENLGSIELNGIRLDTADPRLLDVTEMDLDRHVAMQPAAIAYFGTLRKDAARAVANCKKAYDRWRRPRYVVARAVVDSRSSAKSTVKVEEVKAQLEIDNEAEVVKWEERLDRLQREMDTLDNWYEAWRQKSFTIREHAQIEEDGLYNSNPSMGSGYDKGAGRSRVSTPQAPVSRAERVREMIGKRRQGAAETGQ